MEYTIKEERLSAEEYIDFLKHTDLGSQYRMVKKLHRLAGGEDNIIMYTCHNENALGFYEKLGMSKPDDVVVLNRIQWTDFTVE